MALLMVAADVSSPALVTWAGLGSSWRSSPFLHIVVIRLGPDRSNAQSPLNQCNRMAILTFEGVGVPGVAHAY
jgi:hypothetical protein